MIDTYLDGFRSRVREAGLRAKADPSPEAARAFLVEHRAFRRAELNHLGVDCPVCGGDGERVVGWEHVNYASTSPPEAVVARCKPCRGEGLMLPQDKIRFLVQEGLSLADAQDAV